MISFTQNALQLWPSPGTKYMARFTVPVAEGVLLIQCSLGWCSLTLSWEMEQERKSCKLGVMLCFLSPKLVLTHRIGYRSSHLLGENLNNWMVSCKNVILNECEMISGQNYRDIAHMGDRKVTAWGKRSCKKVEVRRKVRFICHDCSIRKLAACSSVWTLETLGLRWCDCRI